MMDKQPNRKRGKWIVFFIPMLLNAIGVGLLRYGSRLFGYDFTNLSVVLFTVVTVWLGMLSMVLAKPKESVATVEASKKATSITS